MKAIIIISSFGSGMYGMVSAFAENCEAHDLLVVSELTNPLGFEHLRIKNILKEKGNKTIILYNYGKASEEIKQEVRDCLKESFFLLLNSFEEVNDLQKKKSKSLDV